MAARLHEFELGEVDLLAWGEEVAVLFAGSKLRVRENDSLTFDCLHTQLLASSCI